MSKIEWTERTWNPVSGCAKVSPGCKNCYAETMAARLVNIGGKAGADYDGVIDERGRWTGLFRELPHRLDVPLRRKKPTTWFVNSMSDLFGKGVSCEYIAAVFGVMAACPQHRFQVLTKRARRMRQWFAWVERQATVCDEWLADRRRPHHDKQVLLCVEFLARGQIGLPFLPNVASAWPLPNVIIGVSAENQETWDERVPELLACPGRWRFVSAEPLIGSIDVRTSIVWNGCNRCHGAFWDNPLDGSSRCRGWFDPSMEGCRYEPTEDACGASYEVGSKINQVIIGCESRGPALGRPTKVEWIQDLGRQVLDAGAALFVKQADVCERCGGEGVQEDEDGLITGCDLCGGTEKANGTGRAAKLRKDTPAVWIPGYGVQSWRQMPEGW